MAISEGKKIRIILLIVGAFVGLVVGWALGFMWYVFCALVLGWGDSAPDWYFKIQDTVQTTIFGISIIAGIVGLQLLYQRATKKRNGMAQQFNQGDGE